MVNGNLVTSPVKTIEDAPFTPLLVSLFFPAHNEKEGGMGANLGSLRSSHRESTNPAFHEAVIAVLKVRFRNPPNRSSRATAHDSSATVHFVRLARSYSGPNAGLANQVPWVSFAHESVNISSSSSHHPSLPRIPVGLGSQVQSSQG